MLLKEKETIYIYNTPRDAAKILTQLEEGNNTLNMSKKTVNGHAIFLNNVLLEIKKKLKL